MLVAAQIGKKGRLQEGSNRGGRLWECRAGGGGRMEWSA